MVDGIHRRTDFAALRSPTGRGRSGPLRVSHVRDHRRAAVAYAVGRSVGTAVVRNRIRRRLRAAMTERARRGALPDGLYLVGSGPAAATMSWSDLRSHLGDAVAAASEPS